MGQKEHWNCRGAWRHDHGCDSMQHKHEFPIPTATAMMVCERRTDSRCDYSIQSHWFFLQLPGTRNTTVSRNCTVGTVLSLHNTVVRVPTYEVPGTVLCGLEYKNPSSVIGYNWRQLSARPCDESVYVSPSSIVCPDRAYLAWSRAERTGIHIFLQRELNVSEDLRKLQTAHEVTSHTSHGKQNDDFDHGTFTEETKDRVAVGTTQGIHHCGG